MDPLTRTHLVEEDPVCIGDLLNSLVDDTLPLVLVQVWDDELGIHHGDNAIQAHPERDNKTGKHKEQWHREQWHDSGDKRGRVMSLLTL